MYICFSLLYISFYLCWNRKQEGIEEEQEKDRAGLEPGPLHSPYSV